MYTSIYIYIYIHVYIDIYSCIKALFRTCSLLRTPNTCPCFRTSRICFFSRTPGMKLTHGEQAELSRASCVSFIPGVREKEYIPGVRKKEHVPGVRSREHVLHIYIYICIHINI